MSPYRPRVSWALQRYLVAEVLKVFLFVLAVIELGYALLAAVLVSRRFDLDLLLLLAVPNFWSTALSILNDTVPLALLFGAGLVYGRVVADRECTALKSCGLSYFQLLFPLILVGAVSGVLGFFVTGFVCPAMNYQKNDVAAFLASQLRYLGEGSNRDFARGNHSLWILHYNGRRLDGIFLGPKGPDQAEQILSPEVTRELEPLTDPFYLFAERGEVLSPEDAEREWRAKLAEALSNDEPAPKKPPAGTFFLRLYKVRLFFSDQILSSGEPSDFMQRVDCESLSIPYDPMAIKNRRLPKHLSHSELIDRMAVVHAENGDDPAAPAYDRAELEVEYHWRWTRTLSFALYPVLAGLIALFLNAENRYLAFFVSCLIVPSIFYSMGTIGQMLGEQGYPAWITMHIATVLLTALFLLGWFLLERRLLR